MEDNVKKSRLSPVTSLLLSLSLALGILVCNLSDHGFLTVAQARAVSCGSEGGSTVIGETLNLNDAVAPDGVAVHNVLVNGQLVEVGFIAGSVRFISGSVIGANGVIVSNGGDPTTGNGVIVSNGDGGTESDGVVVSNGSPCLDGVIVSNGDGSTGTNGVIVSNGDGDTGPHSVIVGDEISASGYVVSASGTANGGTLTGDNLTITDSGVITGQNLLLSGTTIDGGFISVSGTITGISIAPAN